MTTTGAEESSGREDHLIAQQQEQQHSTTAAQATSTTDNDDNDINAAVLPVTKWQRFQTRILPKLLYLSYGLGILWTSLHPSLSILTGELKCRGWFLDEHSLELRFLDAQAKQNSLEVPHFLKKKLPKGEFIVQEDGRSVSLLCDNLPFSASNIQCHRHGDDLFDVVMVQPLSNAMDVTEEALVVVLPAMMSVVGGNNKGSSSSSSSKLHKALVLCIENLADPVETPWLAKTVYFVLPSSAVASKSVSLDDTVSNFLDAYLGQTTTVGSATINTTVTVPPLPPKLSTAILRNLVVVDVTDASSTRIGNNNQASPLTGQTHLSILPQGRHGVLPNGDLVFAVGKLLERTSFMNARIYPNSGSTFLSHGYTQESIRASTVIQKIVNNPTLLQLLARVSKQPQLLQRRIQIHLQDLANMLLFSRTLAFGPVPPHAPALERGIDSLTIKVDFQGLYRRDPSEELMQYILYMIRGLGNLHERLHHSVTLYLLPTPRTFVSHMEYFLPNILLLLPLAIRAFGLLLPAILAAAQEEDTAGKSSSFRTKSKLRIIQFGLCVMAAHVLVPLAFMHTALSYIPSLIITPLVAFPDYASWVR